MFTTSRIGNGGFCVGDLLPGEEFSFFDGTLGVVCKDSSTSHIRVWMKLGTIDARTMTFYRSAKVFALSKEQYRRVLRRRADRKRRLKAKNRNEAVPIAAEQEDPQLEKLAELQSQMFRSG